MEWERGFLEVARSRTPGPPDKNKTSAPHQTPNPHLEQAEAKRPTMFHCYAHHALLLRSVRH